MSKAGDPKGTRGARPKGDQLITDPDPLKEVGVAKPTRIDSLPDDFALAGVPSLQAGDRLAERYELRRRLGQGAMGEVWQAENIAIGLQVAIKLVKVELLADELFRKRFQREAQAIAAIKHPRVARIFDLVVGHPTFLVMEYVDGVTLGTRMERGRLSYREAVEVAIGLCEALDAAHKAGVIHRDLKPSNVILAERGPSLIDFGLAKLSSHKDTSLTATGQMVGTPYYMSPEQVDGKEVDQRSDVYSLGCVLYEMVAGRPPFTGKTSMQVLYKHVHEALSPLDLPPAERALNQVLAAALAKDPARRIESMTELRRALVGLQGEPPARELATEVHPKLDFAAPETGPIPRAPRGWSWPAWLQTRPRQLAVAGAAGLLVIVALIVALLSGRSDGTLLVLSEPRGARVLVDGKPTPETTPAIVRGLKPGHHRVRLQADGFSISEGYVDLVAGGRESFQVSLRPQARNLEVVTVPAGASVFVSQGDDADQAVQALGVTPMTVSLTMGDFYRLRLEKPGYESTDLDIKPEDTAPSATLTLLPEKRPRGLLMVDANEAAQVWIDGVYTGFTTPTIAFRESVGDHVVELRSAGGLRSLPVRVNIRQGDTKRLYLSTR
jgi:tRNA A-37 threonylcarbamoyl transferase component Bud32